MNPNLTPPGGPIEAGEKMAMAEILEELLSLIVSLSLKSARAPSTRNSATFC
jgi:hypothetical protein